MRPVGVCVFVEASAVAAILACCRPPACIQHSQVLLRNWSLLQLRPCTGSNPRLARRLTATLFCDGYLVLPGGCADRFAAATPTTTLPFPLSLHNAMLPPYNDTYWKTRSLYVVRGEPLLGGKTLSAEICKQFGFKLFVIDIMFIRSKCPIYNFV